MATTSYLYMNTCDCNGFELISAVRGFNLKSTVFDYWLLVCLFDIFAEQSISHTIRADLCILPGPNMSAPVLPFQVWKTG
jgi:hypothetical protein